MKNNDDITTPSQNNINKVEDVDALQKSKGGSLEKEDENELKREPKKSQADIFKEAAEL